MNKVFLIGNLAKNPELMTTKNGTMVCKLSLAVNRGYTNGDGEKITDFFNITCWRGIAETCAKWLSKGSKVCVCGSLQNRVYEKGGVKQYIAEIVAADVEFLVNRRNDTQSVDTFTPMEELAGDGEIDDTTGENPTNNGQLPF